MINIQTPSINSFLIQERMVGLSLHWNEVCLDPENLCLLHQTEPNRSGGGGGGITAKDALGNDVIATEWLKTHGPGDRTLTQGLKVLIFVTLTFSATSCIGFHFTTHNCAAVIKCSCSC